MSPERPQNPPNEKPPEWWHDAIRKNIPGNQYDPDTFLSQTYWVSKELSCTIVSLTAPDPESKIPSGIYLVTNIPTGRLAEFDSLTTTAFSDFRTALNNEYKKRKDLNLATPGANDIAIPIKESPFFRNGKIYASLLFDEDTSLKMNNVENAGNVLSRQFDRLNRIYFGNLDDAGRIKLLFDKNFPDVLKMAYLKRELTNNKFILEFYFGTKEATPRSLKLMASNEPLQKEFLGLLRKIARSKTSKEGEKLIDILAGMEGKKFAGWLDFYRRYWEKKFGPLT